MPPLAEDGLWPAQITAVRNLEESLREDRPRALIQMATGSGKTFTAITAIYRLIKFGGARRVLFLVDRANLGRQALKEFQQYTHAGRRPQVHRAVQRPAPHIEHASTRSPGSCITTIQRLYSMLQGDAELDPELEEGSQFDTLAALLTRAGAGRLQPGHPDRDLRRRSSPTSATARSTTSGARCWSTSTPT